MSQIMLDKSIQPAVRSVEAAKAYIEGYWTERTEDFAQLRAEELHSGKHERWEQEIFHQLPEGKTLCILDVGCGSGFFSVLLAAAGHQVTAVDLTASMIEAGRRMAQAENCTVDFLVMDAENLTFADEVFDVVISRNLVWTLPNPQQAYTQWLRVLKPGGLLLNYDAEYAKDHHHQKLPSANAHQNISDTLLDKCHNIYHMLEISGLERPVWDMQMLKSLGCQECEVDTAVGSRVYKEEDQFYIPVPMFGIRAIK
ncbi:MAG: class I SAM-dependent methyltransferase [Lachnospiraceae bacterium]